MIIKNVVQAHVFTYKSLRHFVDLRRALMLDHFYGSGTEILMLLSGH